MIVLSSDAIGIKRKWPLMDRTSRDMNGVAAGKAKCEQTSHRFDGCRNYGFELMGAMRRVLNHVSTKCADYIETAAAACSNDKTKTAPSDSRLMWTDLVCADAALGRSSSLAAESG